MKRFSQLLILAFVAIVATQTLMAQSPATYADGAYVLDYQDPELGAVFVSVLVKDGRVAALEFPKGLGDLALDEAALKQYVARFVAAPDFMNVDAISGATQSCDLIKYAVQNALKLAIKK